MLQNVVTVLITLVSPVTTEPRANRFGGRLVLTQEIVCYIWVQIFYGKGHFILMDVRFIEKHCNLQKRMKRSRCRLGTWQGTTYWMKCILAPPAEYDRSICVALRLVASITVATCYYVTEVRFVCML